jgi:two-component system, sensor histidine kinase LadS
LRLFKRWSMACALLMGLWLGSGATMAAAQAPVLLRDNGTVDLAGEPELLVPRGSVAIADVLAGRVDDRFGRSDAAIVPLGADKELWIRLRLQNPFASARGWHLDYVLPAIDEVTLFQREGGAWVQFAAGDRVPRSQWQRGGRYPRFHLDFEPGQDRVLYLRVRNNFPAPLPLRVIAEPLADASEQAGNVGFGIVLGALALLASACLLQAVLYRDQTYFLYAAFTLLTGLSFASLAGLAGQFLWGDRVPWNDVAKAVLPLSAAGVSVWLVRSMCRVSVRQPRLSKSAVLVGWLQLALALVTAVTGSVLAPVVGSAMLLAAATVLAIAVSTWRRGDPMGGWVLAAHAPLIAVTALIVVRMFGFALLRFDANLLLALAIGAVLPLLLAGLYQQSRELLAVQVRAREMSSTDALTGLLAPNLFGNRVLAAVARWRKSRHNAVLMYVQLVNAERIRELHGGAAVEQSMIRSAIKLQQQMADADCIGRVSENTMGVILESVTDRAVIMERASRLVAHGLMPLNGLKPNVTLHYHVVFAILSKNQLEAADLHSALEAVLGAMSPRTRRPIRFLEVGTGGVPAPPGPEADTGLGALTA